MKYFQKEITLKRQSSSAIYNNDYILFRTLGGQTYLSPDDAAPKNKSRERTNDPDRCASGILERFAKSSRSVNCRVIVGQERGPGEKPSTSSGRGKPFQPRALVAAIFASGNWKDTAPAAQLRNLYSLFRERERMRRKGKRRWRNGGRGGEARSSGEHDHSETHVPGFNLPRSLASPPPPYRKERPSPSCKRLDKRSREILR